MPEKFTIHDIRIIADEAIEFVRPKVGDNSELIDLIFKECLHTGQVGFVLDNNQR